MGIRFRIFIIIFISMGLGVLIANIFASDSNISLLIASLFLFILATAASTYFANFTFKSITDLEKATSKIAEGKTKKKYIKALQINDTEIGGVAKSIFEISENLKDKINLIATQRDQFGAVLDDLGEGVIVANKDGEIKYENDQFSQILNLNEVIGKKIEELNIKPLDNLFRRSKKKKRADVEFEIELNDKSTRLVLATINKSKSTNEFIMVVHDITQLRSLDSMRRDFISNLSHELRTPVSVIRANSETLIDGALEDKKQAKVFAKAILHNSERLTDMVSSLLDLTRIEYGELKLNFKKIDLNEFINNFIISISSLAKKKDINIKFQSNHKGDIYADPQAIERIMNNLIDNAIKYSEKGSEILVITKNDSDSFIKVMIEDSGSGISDEDQDFIFSRFYRTASARATDNQGSGLGLAIVKHLVNSLNGEVGIDSVPEKGSVFWFTVPKT
jgi:two-component system phosphate regulon sensor histidine kinase PhoR